MHSYVRMYQSDCFSFWVFCSLFLPSGRACARVPVVRARRFCLIFSSFLSANPPPPLKPAVTARARARLCVRVRRRQFCFLLSLVSIPAGLLDVAFAAADTDGSGTIDVGELDRLVKVHYYHCMGVQQWYVVVHTSVKDTQVEETFLPPG